MIKREGFLYGTFYVTAFWIFMTVSFSRLMHMEMNICNAFGFAFLYGFGLRLSLRYHIQRFITLFSLFILFRPVDFYGEAVYLCKKALNFIIIQEEFDLI